MLLVNVITSALIWIPFIVMSLSFPDNLRSSRLSFLSVEPLTQKEHLLLALKAVIAGTSWIFALFGMKHLPLSIAAPIRASSPFWTVLVATVWMKESPTMTQWLGILVIMLAFRAFSSAGRREGIIFHQNRWVVCMIAATLLGSLSALYDKYLLQSANISAAAVQAWFSVYLVGVMLPLNIHWYFRRKSEDRFVWRWSILMIPILLLVSDFLYFSAIRDPEAMISVVSPMRRTSIIIPFLAGTIFLKEKNFALKACCLAAMLCGVYIISCVPA